MKGVEQKAGQVARRLGNVFFNQSRQPDSIRFHITYRRLGINPSLLSAEDIKTASLALEEAGVYSSVGELNQRATAGEFLAVRIAGCISNDAQARLLEREGKYLPRMVISGESGIYNSLVFTKAICLPDVFCLIKEEARAVKLARNTHFSPRDGLDDPFHKPILERFLGNFQRVLGSIEIKQPELMLIGGRGEQLCTIGQIKQELTRQAITPYDGHLVDKALKHASRPFEIGLDLQQNDTKKYLTVGAALVGTAGVVAILAVVVHKRHQRKDKLS